MRKPALLIALIAIALTAAAGEKSTSDLKFSVVKDENGKPVRNASVVLHEVNKHGKQSKGGLQLKTDLDGNASYSGIPYGKIRVQVIAPGFQTFGEDYDINQPTTDIVIKLQKPKDQYTIYK